VTAWEDAAEVRYAPTRRSAIHEEKALADREELTNQAKRVFDIATM
jgi:hypothetical protein